MEYKVYGDGCLIIISNAIFDDDIRHVLCPISLLNQIIYFKKEYKRRFKTLRCYYFIGWDYGQVYKVYKTYWICHV
jgi:hypothetical protein